jgi:hypothetical protein
LDDALEESSNVVPPPVVRDHHLKTITKDGEVR